MEILDQNKNILSIGDWVIYINYSYLVLDMNNSLFKQEVYPGVSSGAIAIAGPYDTCSYYENWNDYPYLKSQLDKCFMLQHRLFWVWPEDVSKIDFPCLNTIL